MYESPILAVTAIPNNETSYVVLDTGAGASLITKSKANQLNLRIFHTTHTAVQIDGVSDLRILGEVHTHFKRGDVILEFHALVVDKMGSDIQVLAGCNFHVENNVSSNMYKNKVTITINGTIVIQGASPTLLSLDKLDCKERLVSTQAKVNILPGEEITFKVPNDIIDHTEFSVEPNLSQSKAFFEPCLVSSNNGLFKITNQSSEVLTLKKNCQAIKIRKMIVDPEIEPLPMPKLSSPIKTEYSLQEILKSVTLDNSGKLSKAEIQPCEDVIKLYQDVFQPTLPGYNNKFGTVHANIEFNSTARPPPIKTRSPNYGAHGLFLYNEKCLQMRAKNVLLDPLQIGVQPLLINNAWIIKKSLAVQKRWEECTVADVRLVTAFDFLNQYLQSSPSKAASYDIIYSSIAGWRYMSELDFSDMYFQMKFDTSTEKAKKKLAYLGIRTAYGTMVYSRAPMGLLGSDVTQEELTDRMFGDLIVQGKLVKIADNVYFGADTKEEMLSIFTEILSRCSQADLRIKPAKVKLFIVSADILGLHWQEGKLSPSSHKLDPLVCCDPPKSVRGLRSFMGSVRFNQICLPGVKLAKVSAPLDAEIPASRSGKDTINWTPTLLSSFKAIQQIIKSPLMATVPRKGDSCFIATDACSTLPACGTKLFISRPNVTGYLPSFNFGFRVTTPMLGWSSCEIEAFALNKAVRKHEHFIKLTQNPAVALVDSKATSEAYKKLCRGEVSVGKRLQDLLVNLSSRRISIQHISAKLPSPLLTMVDFASRNPVECTSIPCSICEDVKAHDVTFFEGLQVENPGMIPRSTWRDIQKSCGDVATAHRMLTSGKNVHKKQKGMKDVKTYMNKGSISKDGLLVVKKQIPFETKPIELIVVPRKFAKTVIECLHNNLDHPLPSQMQKQLDRRYFMLDGNQIIKDVDLECSYPCQALKKLPKETFNFKTETKVEVPGSYFNADVMEDYSQKILILRCNLTSFSITDFVKDQRKDTLREALTVLSSKIRLAPNITIRLDGQASFKSLVNDQGLDQQGISLVIGHSKNVNKNSPAEKSVRELRDEILKISPSGGPISPAILAKATRNMNCLIRHSGRSAVELWTCRDQTSGARIDINDQTVSDLQLV